MKLFIRIKDGAPFEHPIFDEETCSFIPPADTAPTA